MTDPPWRFKIGARVYAHNFAVDDAFEVIGGELIRTFPHYLLRNLATGEEWLMPQLQLSSRPLTAKNR